MKIKLTSYLIFFFFVIFNKDIHNFNLSFLVITIKRFIKKKLKTLTIVQLIKDSMWVPVSSTVKITNSFFIQDRNSTII